MTPKSPDAVRLFARTVLLWDLGDRCFVRLAKDLNDWIVVGPAVAHYFFDVESRVFSSVSIGPERASQVRPVATFAVSIRGILSSITDRLRTRRRTDKAGPRWSL